MSKHPLLEVILLIFQTRIHLLVLEPVCIMTLNFWVLTVVTTRQIIQNLLFLYYHWSPALCFPVLYLYELFHESECVLDHQSFKLNIWQFDLILTFILLPLRISPFVVTRISSNPWMNHNLLTIQCFYVAGSFILFWSHRSYFRCVFCFCMIFLQIQHHLHLL